MDTATSETPAPPLTSYDLIAHEGGLPAMFTHFAIMEVLKEEQLDHQIKMVRGISGGAIGALGFAFGDIPTVNESFIQESSCWFKKPSLRPYSFPEGIVTRGHATHALKYIMERYKDQSIQDMDISLVAATTSDTPEHTPPKAHRHKISRKYFHKKDRRAVTLNTQEDDTFSTAEILAMAVASTCHTGSSVTMPDGTVLTDGASIESLGGAFTFPNIENHDRLFPSFNHKMLLNIWNRTSLQKERDKLIALLPAAHEIKTENIFYSPQYLGGYLELRQKYMEKAYEIGREMGAEIANKIKFDRSNNWL